MNDFLLSYDTVTLRPRYSELNSRANADTSVDFFGYKFRLPVVPANMSDVIDVNIARWLSSNDYFYIMHRFGTNLYEFLKLVNEENWKIASVSIGTSGFETELSCAVRDGFRIDYVTIDVAHGHHKNMEHPVKWLKEYLPSTKIIVGNVATEQGVDYLMQLGADAIKVGIGGGGICTTRYKTGFHLPTLESIRLAREHLDFMKSDIKIIADGGAKHYGDIAKALTFGADMVMSGGWFASCIDSPAKIENGKKIYRGSTSYAAKGENKHVEGRTLELEFGATYAERLMEIQQSLQSSISYAGGKDLSAFNSVSWDRILPFH
jgi:GMP reductase